MATNPGYAWFDVAEARRAAAEAARQAGVGDIDRIDRIMSAAGRRVAQAGQINAGEIADLAATTA